MSDDIQSLYQQAVHYARRTTLLISADALLGWDERTMMPSAGAEHRAEQMTVLAGIIHQRQTDPKWGEWLVELGESPLADDPHGDTGATIRRLRRQFDKKVKLPQSLVEELARMAVLGQNAWQAARANDDYASFRPLLQRIIELKREEAEALGYPECPYDALLDDYEPEALTRNVAAVLAELRDALVPLVAAIGQSGRQADLSILERRYPIEQQEAFGRETAARIGFDFARGRLDVTAHPFCTGLGPNDCRITTRYDEHAAASALFGILHEAGHGIYEQGLPSEHFGLPLGEATSLGIHESQSRMWENLVGRSRAFWRYHFPLARQCFPEALGDVAPEEFYFAINAVRPSLVRVEADEATYNLHILIRFELEQSLLSGDLTTIDLPGAWNEKYRQYLGIQPPNNALGVLQDVHWSGGAIGYFPTYALGNLYAAQLFAQADADIGPLDEPFAQGDFAPLGRWLSEKVHCHGQRYSAAELIQRVTGRPVDSTALVAHLRAKLSPLYGLER